MLLNIKVVHLLKMVPYETVSENGGAKGKGSYCNNVMIVVLLAVGAVATATSVVLIDISTTVASQTSPVFIVEPKFELMLKVERLSTYLQHVKCFELVDYNGTVTYEEANNKRVRGDDYPNPNPNPTK